MCDLKVLRTRPRCGLFFPVPQGFHGALTLAFSDVVFFSVCLCDC